MIARHSDEWPRKPMILNGPGRRASTVPETVAARGSPEPVAFPTRVTGDIDFVACPSINASNRL